MTFPIETYETPTELDLTNSISILIDGGVCGCSISYQVDDLLSLDMLENIAAKDISLHLEFEAVIIHPTLETYFQVTTYYEHISTHYEIVPFFNYDMDGGSYSFSLAQVTEKDSYMFCLDESVHYVP